MKFWILDADNNVVEVEDLLEWGRWIEDANRTVDLTQITSEVTVSTVFLGIDHRFPRGSGPPLLFETMVFRGDDGDEMERYSSWDDAEIGHKMMVKRIRKQLGQRIKDARPSSA